VKSVFKIFAVALTLVSATGNAADEAAIKNKLSSMLDLNVETMSDSPIPGLVQVSTERGLFYVSEDAKYLVQARIFNIDEGMRNETEQALSTLRVDSMKPFASSAISFKAADEKHVINVFTDITCGYCRKFHNEIDELNRLGITVNYLAFPRAGLNSPTYGDMVAVWCAENPQQALTDAKAGDSVPSSTCKNTVAEQYQLGQKLGVNGTPNIILPDGELIPGYQPAAVLLQRLNQAG